MIAIIRREVPEALPGLAYGLPAFKYRGRPLIGFSSNRLGLNLYSFDPRIIAAVAHELRDFELSKGLVRFSASHPVPERVIVLMLDLRREYLDSQEGN